jgi:uracil-DNA glycosylase
VAFSEYFVRELAGEQVAPDACNQYADDGSAQNARRRANLVRYLQQMAQLRPLLLLVGEAPGYLGCRRTGVPFSSERLLLDGIEPFGLLGSRYGYQRAWDDGPPRSEQTATILWGELQALGLVAVGWNAFPFHPHRVGLPLTNRAPRAGEVRQGQRFLSMMLEHFAVQRVVAVGRVAAATLGALGVAHTPVRHPAQGGKQAFARGLQAVARELGMNSGERATMELHA